MDQEIIIIKKYSNRRLYNTSTSSYVNLRDIVEIIREQKDFKVIDAQTGDDLTHATIIQVILEQETKGYGLLPTSFLKMVVLAYDQQNSTNFKVLMERFVENYEIYKKYNEGFDKKLEEITEENIRVMTNMFKMFYPQTPKEKE